MARLTPQQKKCLEYERDRHRDANHPHAYRRIRPMLKAVASRTDRRRAERLLDGLQNQPTDAVMERAEDDGLTATRFSGAARTENFWPRPVLTVRERVDGRIEGRVNRATWRFLDVPYDSAAHRVGFVRFLESVVASSGSYARGMATILANAVDPALAEMGTPCRRDLVVENARWLHAFFRDAPEWEPRLREWTRRVLEAGE